MTRSRGSTLAALALVLILLTACGSAANTSSASSSVAPGLAATAADRRVPVVTPFGDPAQLDLCQAQSTPIDSAGIALSDTQFLGSCRWNITAKGAYFDISASFEKPGYVKIGALVSSTDGIKTYQFDDASRCGRVLRGTDYEVSVVALNPQGALRSEDYCFAMRIITTATVRLLTSGEIVKRPLAQQSLSRIDLCRTLSAAKAATLLGARSAQVLPVLSNTSCLWSGDNNAQVAAQAATTTNYGTIAADTRVVDGHRLISPAGGVNGCNRLSLQGGVAQTKGREVIDVQVRGGSNACAIADRVASAVLGSLHAS